MKMLFRQKQWWIIQCCWAAFAGWEFLGQGCGGKSAALLQLNINDLGLPIFLAMLCELAFTTEYNSGTFITGLLCGQSRKRWMLRQIVRVSLFALLQGLIGLAVCTVAVDITGHGGLQGFLSISIDTQSVVGATIIRGHGLQLFALKALTILLLVDLGIFFSTMMPGKLMAGSMAGIATVYLTIQLASALDSVVSALHLIEGVNRFVRIVDVLLLQDIDAPLCYACAILYIVIAVWAAVCRVDHVELRGQGA